MKVRWVVRWWVYRNARNLERTSAFHITAEGSQVPGGEPGVYYRVGTQQAEPLMWNTREEAEAVCESTRRYWLVDRPSRSGWSPPSMELEVVARRVP